MPTSASEPTAGPVERLRRSADYQRVQSRGRRVRSPHLLLVYAPGEAPRTRVGWAVSRKVGNAVQRNRIKRWLREVVRRVSPPAAGAWDLVLIPNASTLDAGFAVLSGEVADLFRRVRA